MGVEPLPDMHQNLDPCHPMHYYCIHYPILGLCVWLWWDISGHFWSLALLPWVRETLHFHSWQPSGGSRGAWWVHSHDSDIWFIQIIHISATPVTCLSSFFASCSVVCVHPGNVFCRCGLQYLRSHNAVVVHARIQIEDDGYCPSSCFLFPCHF